jgi:hypothetical protein
VRRDAASGLCTIEYWFCGIERRRPRRGSRRRFSSTRVWRPVHVTATNSRSVGSTSDKLRVQGEPGQSLRMAIECFWRPKQLLPVRSSRLGHRPRARSTAKIVPAPVVCSQRLGPCAAASRFGARELVVRDAVTMAEGLHDVQSLPATLAVRIWFAANRAVRR